MNDAKVVLFKTLAMFLVILVGWAARRRSLLDQRTVGILSRLVVDVAFPALVVNQVVQVSTAELRACWYYPVAGFGIMALGMIVGLLAGRLFARPEEYPTFVFLVAISNWIFLPLPILEGLYGAQGVRVVVLFNIGAQLYLWTLGVWTLRGGRVTWKALRGALNPGLVAAVGSATLVLTWPDLARHLPTPSPTLARGLAAVLEALGILGGLTVPLSLLITGAQLDGAGRSGAARGGTIAGVLVTRLVAVPFAALGVLWLGALAGMRMPQMPLLTTLVIAAMPVAVSCTLLTERFGGSTPLAARSIFWSTVFSVATVPAFILLARAVL